MAISKVIYDSNTLIDLTSDTVSADNLVDGYIAHNAAGEQISGSLKYISYYSGSDDPSTSVGSDGDLYFKV